MLHLLECRNEPELRCALDADILNCTASATTKHSRAFVMMMMVHCVFRFEQRKPATEGQKKVKDGICNNNNKIASKYHLYLQMSLS